MNESHSINAQQKQLGQDRDSLRFSNFQLEKINILEQLRQSKEIEFKFEQEPSQLSQVSQRTEQSRMKRKKVFEKYRKKEEKIIVDGNNRILDQLDDVFSIKKRPSIKKRKNSKDFSNRPTQESLQIYQNQQKLPTKKEDSYQFFLSNLKEDNFFAPKDNKNINQEQLKDLSQSTVKKESETEVFDYGKNEDKKDVVKKNYLQDPIFQEEERFPLFLRNLRKMNSIYPNLHNPNMKKQKQACRIRVLAVELSAVLNILESIWKGIEQKRIHVGNFFRQNYNLHYFLNSGWEKTCEIPDLDKIKPKTNFPSRPFDEKKIKKAFENYRNVTQYYLKKPEMNLPEEATSYFSIRVKFWEIERNLRIISEDIYRQSLNYLFPQHYYAYLKALKTPKPTKDFKESHIKLIQKIEILRRKRDGLSSSIIGETLKKKLESEIKCD